MHHTPETLMTNKQKSVALANTNTLGQKLYTTQVTRLLMIAETIIKMNQVLLKDTQQMYADQRVIFYGENSPIYINDEKLPQILLLGTTPEHAMCIDTAWHAKAVFILRYKGYKGWIYVPACRGAGDPKKHEGVFTTRQDWKRWVSNAKMSATHVICWMPQPSKADSLYDLCLALLGVESEVDKNHKRQQYFGRPGARNRVDHLDLIVESHVGLEDLTVAGTLDSLISQAMDHVKNYWKYK